MSDSPETPKPETEPKAKGGGNKLLMIIALANFLGVFAVGGYLVYDKLYASHAAAQAKPEKKGEGHGEEKAEGHGEEKAEGHGEEKAEGHGEEKAEGHGEAKGGHGESKAGAHGEGDPSLEPPDSPGPIMALEPIVTNLAEPDSDRYLKVTLNLRVTSEAAKAEVEASMVPIRSQILMYVSSLNVGDVSGAEKRRAIQNQLRRIANEAMPSSRIRYVYMTEFVIQ